MANANTNNALASVESDKHNIAITNNAVWRAATIRVGEGEIYFREAGSGPPLLLVHGIGSSADAFEPVMSPLAERWRVIAYDRRGCSRSPGEPYAAKGHFARHAADAATLLRALGAAPASVLGWSSGGIVALTLAVEHPEVVSRLVLYEPDLHLTEQRSMGLAALLAKTLLLGAIGCKRAAAAVFMRAALRQADGTSGFDSLDEAKRETVLTNADALLAELKAGTGEELTLERLRSIRCPVTDIVGGESARFLIEASNRLEKGMPQMRVVRVSDANHIMVLQRPGEFVRLLTEALCDSPGTPTRQRS
jgi:pimeloyl-ACP methyl ester carboxylesterase